MTMSARMRFTLRKNGSEMTTVRLPVNLTRDDIEWWKTQAKRHGYNASEWRTVLRHAADDGIYHAQYYSEEANEREKLEQ